jgi:hypothetical protein
VSLEHHLHSDMKRVTGDTDAHSTPLT